jgi:TetR/AcrR family transcriptional repressor of nem operon
MVERVSRLLARGPEQREDEALAVVATLVGALVLSRAVDDPKLSSRILKAGRAGLTMA